MAYFPPVKTPITFRQLITALSLAWPSMPDAPPFSPSARTLCLLGGQWAFETASGASMMNYNVAGIKAGANEDHTYYWTMEDLTPAQAQAVVDASTTAEPAEFRADKVRANGKWRVWVGPNHPTARFRSYASLQAGVTGYLGILKRRYNAAWDAVVHGDAGEFVQKLASLGYFTGNAMDYARGVAGYMNGFLSSYRSASQLNPNDVNGTWDVTIGPWSGIFVFSAPASVYWEDPKAKKIHHRGYWWGNSQSVQWQFDDDPKNARRTFKIDLPFQTPMNGLILPAGMGFFQMSKR
ncbi:MAG: hypothetical protein WA213_20655 [Terriglobales bacterium]